jgi:16S rRNA (uracil1498-N3)-methyltransferase
MTGGFYYAPTTAIGAGEIRLAEEESRHAVKVMRFGVGDSIQVVDGVGGWYLGEIVDVDRGIVRARIIETASNVGEPASELVMGLGVIRNAGRFETFLEKAVELGVTRIVPFESERTQKRSINRKRAERILIAGMKQSMRSRMPHLDETRTLDQLLDDASFDGPEILKLIAHEGVAVSRSLTATQREIERVRTCIVLIGPEGGFSESEVQKAEGRGWRLVSLGQARLRAETAALAAASVIQMIKSTQDGSDRTQD